MPSIIRILVQTAKLYDGPDDEGEAFVVASIQDEHTTSTSASKSSPREPVWNQSLTLELTDDLVLQDWPLRLECFLSPTEALGSVSLDLSMLLNQKSSQEHSKDSSTQLQDNKDTDLQKNFQAFDRGTIDLDDDLTNATPGGPSTGRHDSKGKDGRVGYDFRGNNDGSGGVSGVVYRDRIGEFDSNNRTGIDDPNQVSVNMKPNFKNLIEPSSTSNNSNMITDQNNPTEERFQERFLNTIVRDENVEDSLQGWFPLYDTMKGIVGSLCCTIRIQVITDESYQDRMLSSVGVRFFASNAVPPTRFLVEQLLGFVEELKLVTDPEYSWRDVLRSSRASNEERLSVFYQTSMRARRELGKKVLSMGGNSVLGFQEALDLEGDVTDKITVRCVGTAAKVIEFGEAMLPVSELLGDDPTIPQQITMPNTQHMGMPNNNSTRDVFSADEGLIHDPLSHSHCTDMTTSIALDQQRHLGDRNLNQEDIYRLMQFGVSNNVLAGNLAQQHQQHYGVVGLVGPGQQHNRVGDYRYESKSEEQNRHDKDRRISTGSSSASETAKSASTSPAANLGFNPDGLNNSINTIMNAHQGSTQGIPPLSPPQNSNMMKPIHGTSHLMPHAAFLNQQRGNLPGRLIPPIAQHISDMIEVYHAQQLLSAVIWTGGNPTPLIPLIKGPTIGVQGGQPSTPQVSATQPLSNFPQREVGEQRELKEGLNFDGIYGGNPNLQLEKTDLPGGQQATTNTLGTQTSGFLPPSPSTVVAVPGGASQQSQQSHSVPGLPDIRIYNSSQRLESKKRSGGQLSGAIATGTSLSNVAATLSNSGDPLHHHTLGTLAGFHGNLSNNTNPLAGLQVGLQLHNNISNETPMSVFSNFLQHHGGVSVPKSLGMPGFHPPDPLLSSSNAGTTIIGGVGGMGNGAAVGRGGVLPPIITEAKNVKIITLQRLPIHETAILCGTVVVRAVKVVNSKTTQDTRDSWWSEIRDEIREHALSLGCDTIIGYTERATNYEELLLLSAMGTAAVLQPISRKAFLSINRSCAMVHVPHAGFHSESLQRCSICNQGLVRSTLLATSHVPEGLPIRGTANLVESRVVRMKKRKLVGDTHASEVSDALPFIELELHKQLLFKLKLQNFNAAFGLKVELVIGPHVIVAVASATGVYCEPLPPPPLLKVEPGRFFRTLLAEREASEREAAEEAVCSMPADEAGGAGMVGAAEDVAPHKTSRDAVHEKQVHVGDVPGRSRHDHHEQGAFKGLQPFSRPDVARPDHEQGLQQQGKQQKQQNQKAATTVPKLSSNDRTPTSGGRVANRPPLNKEATSPESEVSKHREDLILAKGESGDVEDPSSPSQGTAAASHFGPGMGANNRGQPQGQAAQQGSRSHGNLLTGSLHSNLLGGATTGSTSLNLLRDSNSMSILNSNANTISQSQSPKKRSPGKKQENESSRKFAEGTFGTVVRGSQKASLQQISFGGPQQGTVSSTGLTTTRTTTRTTGSMEAGAKGTTSAASATPRDESDRLTDQVTFSVTNHDQVTFSLLTDNPDQATLVEQNGGVSSGHAGYGGTEGRLQDVSSPSATPHDASQGASNANKQQAKNLLRAGSRILAGAAGYVAQSISASQTVPSQSAPNPVSQQQSMEVSIVNKVDSMEMSIANLLPCPEEPNTNINTHENRDVNTIARDDEILQSDPSPSSKGGRFRSLTKHTGKHGTHIENTQIETSQQLPSAADASKASVVDPTVNSPPGGLNYNHITNSSGNDDLGRDSDPNSGYNHGHNGDNNGDFAAPRHSLGSSTTKRPSSVQHQQRGSFGHRTLLGQKRLIRLNAPRRSKSKCGKIFSVFGNSVSNKMIPDYLMRKISGGFWKATFLYKVFPKISKFFFGRSRIVDPSDARGKTKVVVDHDLLVALGQEFSDLFWNIDTCPIKDHLINRMNWIIEYHRNWDTKLIRSAVRQFEFEQSLINFSASFDFAPGLPAPSFFPSIQFHHVNVNSGVKFNSSTPKQQVVDQVHDEYNSRQQSGDEVKFDEMNYQSTRNLQPGHQTVPTNHPVQGPTSSSNASYAYTYGPSQLQHNQNRVYPITNKKVFVFDVDDPSDEDLLAALDDPVFPPSIAITTIDCLVGGGGENIRQIRDVARQTSMVYALRRAKLDATDIVSGTSYALSRKLSLLMNEIYTSVLFKDGGGGEFQDGGIEDGGGEFQNREMDTSDSELEMLNSTFQIYENSNFVQEIEGLRIAPFNSDGIGNGSGGRCGSGQLSIAPQQADAERGRSAAQHNTAHQACAEEIVQNNTTQRVSYTSSASSSSRQGHVGPTTTSPLDSHHHLDHDKYYSPKNVLKQVKTCLSAVTWRLALLDDDLIELVLVGQVLSTAGGSSQDSERMSDMSPVGANYRGDENHQGYHGGNLNAFSAASGGDGIPSSIVVPPIPPTLIGSGLLDPSSGSYQELPMSDSKDAITTGGKDSGSNKSGAGNSREFPDSVIPRQHSQPFDTPQNSSCGGSVKRLSGHESTIGIGSIGMMGSSTGMMGSTSIVDDVRKERRVAPISLFTKLDDGISHHHDIVSHLHGSTIDNSFNTTKDLTTRDLPHNNSHARKGKKQVDSSTPHFGRTISIPESKPDTSDHSRAVNSKNDTGGTMNSTMNTMMNTMENDGYYYSGLGDGNSNHYSGNPNQATSSRLEANQTQFVMMPPVHSRIENPGLQIKRTKIHSPNSVFVTPLASLPNCRIRRYVGLVIVHLIKETTSLKRDYHESLQVFYNTFISEGLEIARSQVFAVGGNACLSYRLSNLFLGGGDSGRAYALISICGDAAVLDFN